MFSGGGGLDLGLESVGYRTLMTIDVERYACETLRSNQCARHKLPTGRRYLAETLVIERDVRRVPGSEILRRLGLRPGELDVLCGGPPCVSFSIAGPRQGLAADTGRLFEAYARLLRTLRPRAFIFENVRGLLSAVDADGVPGGAWATIHGRLESAGYRLSSQVLNAADFGVPQHRERLIVVGLRGRRGSPFEFPRATHAHPNDSLEMRTEPWKTVREAIGDLPPAPFDSLAAEVRNHVARRHSANTVAAFAATAPGKRNPTFKRDRLRWDKPATVVRAQGKPKRGGGGRNSSHQALHPEIPRQLTIRECARIQSFPDWYEFPTTFSNGYRVVGDAVPPGLASVIGRELMGYLRGARTARTERMATEV